MLLLFGSENGLAVSEESDNSFGCFWNPYNSTDKSRIIPTLNPHYNKKRINNKTINPTLAVKHTESSLFSSSQWVNFTSTYLRKTTKQTFAFARNPQNLFTYTVQLTHFSHSQCTYISVLLISPWQLYLSHFILESSIPSFSGTPVINLLHFPKF